MQEVKENKGKISEIEENPYPQQIAEQASTHDKSYERRRIIKSARVFGIVFFALAVSQFMTALMLQNENDINLYSLYARNSTSIIGFSLIGWFLIRWHYFNRGVIRMRSEMRHFRLLTLTTAFVCCLKGLISISFAIMQSSRGLYQILYYGSDVVSWLNLGIFLIMYYRRKQSSRKHHVSASSLKVVSYILAATSLAKCVISTVYMVLNFKPTYPIWIYYLADTLAWLLLFIFFMEYSHSKLAVKTTVKHRHKK